VDGAIIDGVHECGEELVGLHLVFHEWVLLALRAELDTFAEGVHGVEVLLPFLVDGIEDDMAFERVEVLGVLNLNLALIGRMNSFKEELGIAIDIACFEGGIMNITLNNESVFISTGGVEWKWRSGLTN